MELEAPSGGDGQDNAQLTVCSRYNNPVEGKKAHVSEQKTNPVKEQARSEEEILEGTHIEFLHGASCHVCALEVDKGTESLMQHTNALYLAVPARQIKQLKRAGQVTTLVKY